jgi:hypothetical protein
MNESVNDLNWHTYGKFISPEVNRTGEFSEYELDDDE